MFDKSIRFKQVYQLLLSLIVHTYMNTYIHTHKSVYSKHYDSQEWTSVTKNRRPRDIQNKFKAHEVSDEK